MNKRILIFSFVAICVVIVSGCNIDPAALSAGEVYLRAHDLMKQYMEFSEDDSTLFYQELTDVAAELDRLYLEAKRAGQLDSFYQGVAEGQNRADLASGTDGNVSSSDIQTMYEEAEGQDISESNYWSFVLERTRENLIIHRIYLRAYDLGEQIKALIDTNQRGTSAAWDSAIAALTDLYSEAQNAEHLDSFIDGFSLGSNPNSDENGGLDYLDYVN